MEKQRALTTTFTGEGGDDRLYCTCRRVQHCSPWSFIRLVYGNFALDTFCSFSIQPQSSQITSPAVSPSRHLSTSFLPGSLCSLHCCYLCSLFQSSFSLMRKARSPVGVSHNILFAEKPQKPHQCLSLKLRL